MIAIPWTPPVLAGIYGAIAAAMVILAILALPALFCFKRGRMLLLRASA